MANRTGAARARKLRAIRFAAGWEEVKVWVPSRQAADEVKKLAASKRAQARGLDGLSEAASAVSDGMKMDVVQAIAEHGQAPHPQVPNAVVDLMSLLAEVGDLQSCARAFAIVVRARPALAASAKSTLPEQVSRLLVLHHDIAPTDLRAWKDANRHWKDLVINAIRDPHLFERTVEQMVRDIRLRSASDG